MGGPDSGPNGFERPLLLASAVDYTPGWSVRSRTAEASRRRGSTAANTRWAQFLSKPSGPWLSPLKMASVRGKIPGRMATLRRADGETEVGS